MFTRKTIIQYLFIFISLISSFFVVLLLCKAPSEGQGGGGGGQNIDLSYNNLNMNDWVNVAFKESKSLSDQKKSSLENF